MAASLPIFAFLHASHPVAALGLSGFLFLQESLGELATENVFDGWANCDKIHEINYFIKSKGYFGLLVSEVSVDGDLVPLLWACCNTGYHRGRLYIYLMTAGKQHKKSIWCSSFQGVPQ